MFWFIFGKMICTLELHTASLVFYRKTHHTLTHTLSLFFILFFVSIIFVINMICLWYSGILYTLLQFPQWIDETRKLSIVSTLEYLLSVKLKSGNFPAGLQFSVQEREKPFLFLLFMIKVISVWFKKKIQKELRHQTILFSGVTELQVSFIFSRQHIRSVSSRHCCALIFLFFFSLIWTEIQLFMIL